MSRRSLASVPTTCTYAAPPLPADPCGVLLACAGRCEDRVLVLGAHRLELTCALMRTGCRGVVSARLDGLLPRIRADVVIAAGIGDAAMAEAAVMRIAGVLGHAGRVALGLAPGASPAVARALSRQLGAAGLSCVRRRTVGGMVVVTAERAPPGTARA